MSFALMQGNNPRTPLQPHHIKLVTQNFKVFLFLTSYFKLSRPPDPGPTRLADLNRSLGRETIYTIYYILYTGTLINLFFLRAVPVPVGIQTIFVITKIILHIQKNYHRSGVHHNLYTYIESHLLIPIHFLLNIFCSSGIQNIIILLH